MAIDADKMINVLNENPITVTAQSNLGEYSFGVGSPENPTMQTMKFSEVQYIFRNGRGIQNGLLVFEDDEAAEIYKELGIDSKDILRVKDIEDMLIHPTVDKLQRIIDITNIALFERIRMNLIGLNSTGRFDVSNRVAEVVDKRFTELMSGVRNSKIIIQKADIENHVSVEDIASLQAQIVALQKMLEESNASKEDKNEEDEKPKKAGRPKKSEPAE